ncbi:glycosyltransferase family 8 protein [Labrys wisconsinensis]
MTSNAVCVFCDDNYYPPADILCRQLAAEADKTFDVFLFVEGRNERHAERAERAPYFVRRIDMDTLIPPGAQFSRRISRPAYNRLFMGLLLEERYTKALYLDCDVAVWGPVSALFDLDLQGAPLAAVQDCGFVKQGTPEIRKRWNDYLASVEIPDGQRYFNSGMLLADLTAWRARDMAGLMAGYMARHGARLTGMDQDTLNFIFQGEWAELSPRWNFQLLWSGFGLEEAIDTRIFHYVDNIKPWHDLVFTWGSHHMEDFNQRLQTAAWPDFVVGARRADHSKRFVKWRLRQALRWIPLVGQRFERENRQRRQYRDLTIAHVLQALQDERYLDVRAGLTAIDPMAITKLAQNRVREI